MPETFPREETSICLKWTSERDLSFGFIPTFPDAWSLRLFMPKCFTAWIKVGQRLNVWGSGTHDIQGEAEGTGFVQHD